MNYYAMTAIGIAEFLIGCYAAGHLYRYIINHDTPKAEPDLGWLVEFRQAPAPDSARIMPLIIAREAITA